MAVYVAVNGWIIVFRAGSNPGVEDDAGFMFRERFF
jgi:hypothetical protein